MSDAILVLNAGSSSVKYAIFGAAPGADALTHGQIDRIGQGAVWHPEDHPAEPLPLPHDAGHKPVLTWLTDRLRADASDLNVVAAGHRVVHGGRDFGEPCVVTPAVLDGIRALSPLAPGHQPHNIAGIEALQTVWPDIPQVACFDTAFHRTQPRLAQLFALPRALTDEGVLRYGFHGLSYDYIASQLPSVLGARAEGRVIVMHLGNGASACAMVNRHSVATTMGFTALDGLMMGTRCGDIDPGVLIHLQRTHGYDADGLETLLGKHSGLKGVSELSSDMRDLLASKTPEAAEAVALFAYRASLSVGSLAAAMGGLDALVFTAGIGEHSAEVRALVADRCGWLGLSIDADANDRHQTLFHTAESAVAAAVIPTNEELVIANRTRTLVAAG
ncbi:acetate/propionate family kinase [Actibacterium ureilyticum]|uniref:acetate/propionate family kinase n=1 Tax=Actibacterium ureilyticum TaxID=1590614 RepID=UPI000BAAA795|nr:acetate/propionate family kinase [Actibacterium ureilyticum]